TLLNKKDISPKCEYCMNARKSPDGNTMLCTKKGIVDNDYCCKKFKYDVLKRTPRKPPKLSEFSKDDFSL
ncbi:MAG: hypothetical protein RR355_03990, partial [Oscillospiraceae bacterium]